VPDSWRKTMRKTLLFALLALMTFWMACEISDYEFSRDVIKDVITMPTQAEIEAAKATFEKLKPDFILTEHSTGNESYTHKIIEEKIKNVRSSFDNTKTATATLYIYIYMSKYSNTFHPNMLCEINYIAHRLLSPNKIMIRMDKRIMTSKDLKSDCEFYSFGCIEKIQYRSAYELLSFVIKNPDKEVRVRLVNKDRYYFDFIIDKDMRQAIHETIELYNVLLILKRAEQPPEPPDLFYSSSISRS
jgi:hypothetical protein